MRIAALAVALILFTGVPGLAQGVDSAPAGMTCKVWEKGLGNQSENQVASAVDAVPMKLAYLRGLRYGYEVAVQNLEGLYDKHEKGKPRTSENSLGPEWTTMLVPPEGIAWEDTTGLIDKVCSREENSELSVPELSRAYYQRQRGSSGIGEKGIGRSERDERLIGETCSSLAATTARAWLQGFKDGNEYLWFRQLELNAAQSAKTNQPLARAFLAQLETESKRLRDMFSPDKIDDETTSSLAEFCERPFNQKVPLDLSVAAVNLLQRGMNAAGLDGSLEAFRCKTLEPLWLNGQEVLGRTCAGFTILVVLPPVWDKPIGVVVSVKNDSSASFVVDWDQWSLVWTDRKNNSQTNRALDPQKLAKSIERRSLIAAAIAGFGAAMGAAAPRTTTVYGPQGTQTVTIVPPPNVASEATRQAMTPHLEAGSVRAQTMSDVSLRRTMLLPGQNIVAVVFFEKPKSRQFKLRFSPAEHPTVSILLEPKPN